MAPSSVRRDSSAGFSLTELLVVIAVGSIIIIALTLLVARSFSVSREQFEQVRITEDARIQIDRTADILRNATFIDRNGDGLTQSLNEYWLQSGDDFEVTVYSNTDDDDELELVRYFVDSGSSSLQQEITQLSATGEVQGAPTTRTLLTTLVNRAEERPVFTYYAYGDNQSQPLATPVTTTAVKRVGITLLVDASETQFPPRAEVKTEVTPRSVAIVSDTDQDDTFFKSYSYTGDFTNEAYSECLAFCGVAGTAQCDQWTAALSWSGSTDGYVTSYCTCEASYLPPAAESQLVATELDEMTSFMKSCWEGSTCSNGNRGEPYCVPGCYEEAGECACVCP